VASKNIVITGAEENNLKKINVKIPHNKITTVVGVSGSGKSSLIYSVLAQEAKRREKIDGGFAECKDYAIRPQFEQIDNLPYAITVKQRGLQQSISSTIATITGLHELLRDEFYKNGKIFCQCGAEIHKPTVESISQLVGNHYNNKKIKIYAVVVFEKHSSCNEELKLIKRYGYNEAITISSYDNKEKKRKLSNLKKLNQNYANTIKLYLGEYSSADKIKKLLKDNSELAIESFEFIINENSKYHFKFDYFCTQCNIFYHPISPSLLSFNAKSKQSGQCSTCAGHGIVSSIDYNELIDPNKKISTRFLNLEHNGKCYKYIYFCDDNFRDLLIENKINSNKTFYQLGSEQQKIIKDEIEKKLFKYSKNKNISRYLTTSLCPECNGSRLNYKANAIKLFGMNINDMLSESIIDLYKILKDKNLSHKKILHILRSLEKASVGYLPLSRSTDTLSGGELQRVKIANYLNSEYKGLLYILDEPSTGLHPYDNNKFIEVIKNLTDIGNTIIISEHNTDYINISDHIIELGPGGGQQGGEVTFNGNIDQYIKRKQINEISRNTKKLEIKDAILLKSVNCNNICNQNFTIPLFGLVTITGVSGSGKSSLVYKVLAPAIQQYLTNKDFSKRYVKSISNIEKITDLVELNQSQIGINSRSIIATYLGFFDDIRSFLSNTQNSLLIGLSSSDFSFNSKSGQCEYCKGLGEINNSICPSCLGERFKPHVLSIKYNNFSISDILSLTVEEALPLFSGHKYISLCLNKMIDLGIGYLNIGRKTPSLSGGEGQRLKLVKSLIEFDRKIKNGNILYLLDEPTSGLNIKDTKKLLNIIDEIIDHKNSVIMIEHNTEIIKNSDYIIDLGVGSGINGGKNVFSGNYEALLKNKISLTSQALRGKLKKEDTISSDRNDCRIIKKHRNKQHPTDCHQFYLSQSNFALEKVFASSSELILDKNGYFFQRESALIDHVSRLKNIEVISFNPFTSDLFLYKQVSLSNRKTKLKKLIKLGYESVYINGDIYSLKNNFNEVLSCNVWDIKVIARNIDEAINYGHGWITIITGKTITELFTRLVNINDKIIGSPKITPNIFNRYTNSCAICHGKGYLYSYNLQKIIHNNKLSILDAGFFVPEIQGKIKSTMRLKIKPAIRKFREEEYFDLSLPPNKMNDSELNIFLHGFVFKKFLKPKGKSTTKSDYIQWDGIFKYIYDDLSKFKSDIKSMIVDTKHKKQCYYCNGSGFSREVLYYLVDEKSIVDHMHLHDKE
jgi:excinuclease ABC subunit A